MTCLSIHYHKIGLKILLFSKMTFREIQRLNCTDSSQSMLFYHLFNIFIGRKLTFSALNFFMHIFNMSVTYLLSSKIIHLKL